jgi:hypothetical protein
MNELYKRESEALAKLSAFHLYVTKGEEELIAFFTGLLRFCSENRKRSYEEVIERLLNELTLIAE